MKLIKLTLSSGGEVWVNSDGVRMLSPQHETLTTVKFDGSNMNVKESIGEIIDMINGKTSTPISIQIAPKKKKWFSK